MAFGLCLISLLATNSSYGFAIDEASYLWVAEQERLWFSEFPEKGWSSFSSQSLLRRWHFLESPAARDTSTHSNFNLPLSQHLINVSWLVFHAFTSELTAYRLANMLLFSCTVTALFAWLWNRYGVWAAVVGAGLLLCNPRVFGHAHLAGTETTMCGLWLLTLLAFDPGNVTDVRRRRCFLAGLLLALTMSVKLTSWLLAPPLLAWLLIYRPAGWKQMLLWSACLPIVIIVVLTPPLWHNPIGGLIQYIQDAGSNPWKIPVYFLGSGYASQLPGWSVAFLIGVTTPVATLLLSATALVLGPFRRESALFALPLLFVVIVRWLGLMPLHDGERQFLPVYYCLAGLAAVGFASVIELLQKRTAWKPAVALMTATLGLAALAEPFWDTVRYAGHGLTYYNTLIGGLPGAARQGMEISYWWEGLSHDQWLQFLDDLPQGSRLFVHPDHPGLEYLKRWGIWREDLTSVAPQDADYFLLYGKRAAYVVATGEAEPLPPTDLLLLMERGQAEKEVRFLDVRLAALFAR